MKIKKKTILLNAALLIALALISYNIAYSKKVSTESDQDLKIVKLYKSPTCGCCNGYVSALKDEGFDVDATNLTNLNPIKEKYNIPRSMQSCHTSIIGKYFIEGHIPLEAVKKLLDEQPDIDGIALPGMPSGTPGMPGSRNSPLVIYQLKSGQYSEFMKIW
jgi:hypothetical protein